MMTARERRKKTKRRYWRQKAKVEGFARTV
jgi:hypothetical protein